MGNLAKGLVIVGALAFLGGVAAGFVGGGQLMGIPAESMSRASNNLVLIAIALALVCPRSGVSS